MRRLQRRTVSAATVMAALTLAACSGAGSDAIVTQPATTEMPTSQGASTPSTTPTIAAADTDSDSICGLGGVKLDGTVLEPFDVTETYIGTYPLWTSSEYGPSAQDPSGFYYCYQHSPEGAVMAAMGMSIQGSALDSDAYVSFNQYALGPGPDHEKMMSEVDERGSEEVREEIRARPLGVRVLQYDGATALIDVAIEASYQGTIRTMAGTMPLIWHEGDWKLESDESRSTSGDISSLDGYVLFEPAPEAG